MKTFSSLSFMLYPLFHGVAKYTVYCNMQHMDAGTHVNINSASRGETKLGSSE